MGSTLSRLGRRVTHAAAAAVACTVLVLAAAVPADAASPRYRLGWVDCQMNQIASVGIGFATDFPRVYAANATRRRDLQWAYLHTEFYEFDRPSSMWVKRGWSTYKALASDNNYAIVWVDQSNGERLHFPIERQQFQVTRTGIYRVRQRVVFKRNGVVPGGDSGWRWNFHTGPNSEQDPTSSFCFIR